MAWKKIDDAQALPDMPYSSFLANGLTTNANSYNDDMTRGGGIAWNAHDPVTWSSYWAAQGVMFTVNVGQAVSRVDFRVTYATLTGSADANGFQGYVTLQHMGGSEFVKVGLIPTSGSLSYLDIILPFNTDATGPQAFSLTFQSSKLEDLGVVDVHGGIRNLMYLNEHGGPSEYHITEGEKNILIDLTNTPPPSSDTLDYLNEYQINFISVGDFSGADGVASVYPALPGDPPRLVSYYYPPKNGTAQVYELGAMTLLGIAFNSVSSTAGYAPPQLSHQTAGPLAALIGIQTAALYQFQPDLCNGVSQRYAFGAVVDGGLYSQTISFSFVTNSSIDNLMLSVTMRYFGLRHSGEAPVLTLKLIDENANLVVSPVNTPITVVRETTKASVIGMTARGIFDITSRAKWGMRDSMPQSEMMSGNPVTINVQNVSLLPNKVYTVILSIDNEAAAIYIYNLYARLTTPSGSAG